MYTCDYVNAANGAASGVFGLFASIKFNPRATIKVREYMVSAHVWRLLLGTFFELSLPLLSQKLRPNKLLTHRFPSDGIHSPQDCVYIYLCV